MVPSNATSKPTGSCLETRSLHPPITAAFALGQANDLEERSWHMHLAQGSRGKRAGRRTMHPPPAARDTCRHGIDHGVFSCPGPTSLAFCGLVRDPHVGSLPSRTCSSLLTRHPRVRPAWGLPPAPPPRSRRLNPRTKRQGRQLGLATTGGKGTQGHNGGRRTGAGVERALPSSHPRRPRMNRAAWPGREPLTWRQPASKPLLVVGLSEEGATADYHQESLPVPAYQHAARRYVYSARPG